MANDAAKQSAPSLLIGTVEWFRPGEYERVEQVLESLKGLGVRELRTGFSWADYVTEAGPAWYAWLLPRLARDVNILPCFTYTPPSLAIAPKSSSPPRRPKDYADFLDMAITRHGKYFEWVELWNEPNNITDYDWRLDPGWRLFSEMVAGAAHWCRKRGKKTVLGGTCPTDPSWLDLLARRGVLEQIDAVGVHGFPGTWEHDWEDWADPVAKVRQVLERHGSAADVWITQGGYSTWRHDEYRQLSMFAQLLEAPVSRVYWYAAQDLHPDQPHRDGFHADERHYHFGLLRADGTPKLLYRIWADLGLEGVRSLAQIGREAEARDPLLQSRFRGDGVSLPPELSIPSLSGSRSRAAGRDEGYALIIGGAGFVGTNVAHRLLSSGKAVRIFDNLARPGVEENLAWLRATHGDRLQIQIEDVRNPHALRHAMRRANQVYHFAAQVAVTTSVKDPVEDFEINLRGTFNVLEAVRERETPPPLLFTSTNKVYGGLDDVALQEGDTRYEPADEAVRHNGIARTRALDFHSPYGCSKGGADQYVLDYARLYDLPTVVFRMSCIYGPHQFGTEDQGWVAHFLLRALSGEPITLYGDGKQVRDVLFVEDLVGAMLTAQAQIDTLRGQAFNIGGGPGNTVSLLELIDLIGALHDEKPAVSFDDWRPGDQRYYVSDLRHFTEATGWAPRVPVEEGVRRLYQWLREARTAEAPRLLV